MSTKSNNFQESCTPCAPATGRKAALACLKKVRWRLSVTAFKENQWQNCRVRARGKLDIVRLLTT